MLLPFLGLISLGGAAFLVTRLTKVEVAEHSSRFLGVVFAFVGFYSAATLIDYTPFVVLTPVKIRFLRIGIPVVGGMALLALGFRLWQHRKAELAAVMDGTWRVFLIVIFAAAARMFLSL